MIRNVLLGLAGVLTILAVATLGVFASPPPPSAAAVAFAEALPGGHIAALTTTGLQRNVEFRDALAAWRSRDRTQRLTVQQGPVYADIEAQGLTSAEVEVVTHYAEIYPERKALNWEQDYALTLRRGIFGSWRVSRVRTTAQAVVQALGGYPSQGQTHLVVPISIYLPQPQN